MIRLDRTIEPDIYRICSNLFKAVTDIVESDMQTVSLNMKNILVEGFLEIKAIIAVKAFKYFTVYEFEPTEEIIPLMREVVREYVGGV